jgi:hypothetical protein
MGNARRAPRLGACGADDDALVARRLRERSPPGALGIAAEWAALVAAAERSGTRCAAAAAEGEYDDGDEY